MIRRFTFSCLAASCAAALAQSPPPAPGPASVSSSAVPQEASQSPYYLGVQQSFTRESNVFLAPNGTPKVSDLFSTTTFRAGLQRPLSRQRLYADAELRFNRYNKRSEMNNNGYGLRAGIDWATVERISGTVAFSADRNMSRLATATLGASTVRNVEHSEEIRAVGRIGGTTALTFEVGGDVRVVNFSEAALADREYDRTGVHAAGIYRLSSATNVGLGVAAAKSDYRRDNANRREVYATGQWTPSALTDVQARLAATKVTYDVFTAQDFSGVTGSLTWNWRPTGKTAVSTILARDTGQDIGFLRLAPGQSVAAADFASVTDTLGVRGTYEATSKILVDGGVNWTRRNLANSFLPGQTTGRETSTILSLGARWLPTRNITVGCQLSREQRDSTHDASTSTAYSTRASNDLLGCFGSFTIY
jgi:hypothetical protein